MTWWQYISVWVSGIAAAGACFFAPWAFFAIKDNWQGWWTKLNESRNRRKRYEFWYGENWTPKKRPWKKKGQDVDSGTRG